jgi:hypothetical protein
MDNIFLALAIREYFRLQIPFFIMQAPYHNLRLWQFFIKIYKPKAIFIFMKKKRGLIGKIFLVIGIIFLVVLIIAGITVWQAYSLISAFKQETPKIQSNLEKLGNGDCSVVPEIEKGMNSISSKAKSACMNPIINIAVKNLAQIPIKCSNLPAFQSSIAGNMTMIKEACANITAKG